MRHYSLILRKKSVLLDLGRVLLYYPLFAFLYEAIVFQPKPPFRARFFYCLHICKAFSVQVVVDVNHKQDACDNPVTSHFPYRYFPLLQVV